MYRYNLIVKHEKLDHEAARAMVNRELVKRFGPDIGYIEHAYLTYEIVVIVRGESKRSMQSILGDWFTEAVRDDERASFPTGTLLHYREITADEALPNQLGG